MSTSLLGSGNDGTAKRAIVEFVTSAAVEGSSGFVPPAERIAVFDDDGTLWVEKPAPVQSAFVLGKLAARVQADPSLARKQPYRAIVDEDESFFRALDVQDPDAVTSMVEAIGSAWEGTIFGGVRGRGGSVPGVTSASVCRSPAPSTSRCWSCSTTSGRTAGGCSSARWRARLHAGDLRGDPGRASGERDRLCPGVPCWDGVLVHQAVLRGPVALGPGKPEYVLARPGRWPRFAAGNDDVDVEVLWSPRSSLCSSCMTTTSGSTPTPTARREHAPRPKGSAGRHSA